MIQNPDMIQIDPGPTSKCCINAEKGGRGVPHNRGHS